MTNVLEIENAMLDEVFIGYQDHGILTMTVPVRGEGWYISTGNRALGNAPGSFIKAHFGGLLSVAKKGDIAACKGAPVRVALRDGMCAGLGHITENVWWDGGEKTGKFADVFPGCSATLSGI